MNETPAGRPQRWARGPHAGLLAIVTLLLTLAAVVLPQLIGAHPGYLDPSGSPAQALQQAQQRRTALKINGFLLVGSAPPLAICAAAWCAQYRRRGLTVPGPLIALAGGVLAAAMLFVTGIVQWALSRSHTALSPELAHFVGQLSFGLGGVGFAVPFGLLLAGIAVTGLLSRSLPGPVAVIGIVLAALAELSCLVLLTTTPAFVLPVVRFGGLAWLVLAAFTLAPVRPGRERATPTT